MESENQIDGSDEEGNFTVMPSVKISIQQKRILSFFVALESQLMKTMIMHHRTSLNSKSNIKVTEKKVVRCGIQRAYHQPNFSIQGGGGFRHFGGCLKIW